MIHVRTDECVEPGVCTFRCGIAKLPPGDRYFFEAEPGAWLKADCEGCNPGGPKQFGTPISQLSGRPGQRGFEAFIDVATSWGYP